MNTLKTPVSDVKYVIVATQEGQILRYLKEWDAPAPEQTPLGVARPPASRWHQKLSEAMLFTRDDAQGSILAIKEEWKTIKESVEQSGLTPDLFELVYSAAPNKGSIHFDILRVTLSGDTLEPSDFVVTPSTYLLKARRNVVCRQLEQIRLEHRGLSKTLVDKLAQRKYFTARDLARTGTVEALNQNSLRELMSAPWLAEAEAHELCKFVIRHNILTHHIEITRLDRLIDQHL